ncbi:hypothetical protein [Cohnella sp. 56]|uniref:hypothetical protein n=1 Tax=Cohnella sp. 56 TaxID=3113722 RepID=UPI0030EA797F
MEAALKAILDALADLKKDVVGLQAGQDALRAELQEFRDSQEVSNKLLAGDSQRIKTHLRDFRNDMNEFRRETRDWTRTTDRRIDRLRDRLDGVKDALQ